MRKFQSQLEAVARAMQGARYREGYNSATAAHTMGPHVTAKAAMARAEKTIRAEPAWGVFCGFAESSANEPTKA